MGVKFGVEEGTEDFQPGLSPRREVELCFLSPLYTPLHSTRPAPVVGAMKALIVTCVLCGAVLVVSSNTRQHALISPPA